MIPNAAMALINCFLALSIFFMGMLISTDFLILKPFYLPNLKLTELKANPDLAKRAGAKGIDSSLEYCRCRGSSFYFVLAFNAGILKAEDKMTLKECFSVVMGRYNFWGAKLLVYFLAGFYCVQDRNGLSTGHQDMPVWFGKFSCVLSTFMSRSSNGALSECFLAFDFINNKPELI